MIGFMLSLGSGVLQTFQDSFSKRGLISQRYSDWTIMLARFIYVLPLFIFFWLIAGAPMEFSNEFLKIMIALVSLEVLGQWFYHQSIKIASLSLAKPFLGITPIVIVPVTYVLRGELPSVWGFIGVVMIVAGLLIIMLGENMIKEEATIKLSRKGIFFMIITALLWALTFVLQQSGAKIAGVTFFGVCYIGGVTVILMAYHLVARISILLVFQKKEAKVLLPIGLFSGLSYLFQYWALTLTLAAYVAALKRVSTSLHLYGDQFFFKEKIGRWRIIGNIISVVGTMVLLTGG